MGKITAHAGVLLCRDMTRALRFWRDVFGFTVDNTFGAPPTFAILQRDNAFVMLGATDQPVVPRRLQRESLFDAYFWVDDVRGMFADMTARGAGIDYEPCAQPYGVLECGLTDPDGHLVGFGQILDHMSKS